MKIFRHKTFWKFFLLLFAVLIGMVSLIYTENLVRKLKIEERKNVELWAEATRLISLPDTSQNVEFLSTIIENNNTVPVILTDESDSIISARNFDSRKIIDYKYLRKELKKIKEENKPAISLKVFSLKIFSGIKAFNKLSDSSNPSKPCSLNKATICSDCSGSDIVKSNAR